jgi:hypothetical protein
MDWEMIAPMVVGVVLILTTGGVILLRPLSRRLGDLLEAMAAERRDPGVRDELARVRESVDVLGERFALIEERQEFTDALLRNPENARIRGAGEAREGP